MSDRQVAAGWEAQRFVTAWRQRRQISTTQGWLTGTIESMWLCGDPPDTTLVAHWTPDPDHDSRQTRAALWGPDGSPASTHLRTQLLEDANRLQLPRSEQPATDVIEMHELFEATCAAALWELVHAPQIPYGVRRVGLIGTDPETRLTVEFPTPNGPQEFSSEIWQGPGRPERTSDDLAFDLYLRFREGT